MPNGKWTIGELGRSIERIEEEVKWLRRWLFGTIGAAVVSSLISAAIASWGS
jgi:hypothetical protein